MRVALELYRDDFENVAKCMSYLARKEFNFSTAVYINSGTNHNQLASCFVETLEDDFHNIADSLRRMKDCLRLRSAIGVGLSKIRASGQPVAGLEKITSMGPVAVAHELDVIIGNIVTGYETRSNVAAYLDVWHADVEAFLKRADPTDPSQLRNLFFGLMIPDEFMVRVIKDKEWHLFSPNIAPRLTDAIGDDFTKYYNEYVERGLFARVVKARTFMQTIVNAVLQSGVYIVFKDTVNQMNNQFKLGVVQNLNLCAEIAQVTSRDMIAVCTLGTVNFSKFVSGTGGGGGVYDFERLSETVQFLTKSVDKMVDGQKYESDAARMGASLRAIGIGASGFANVLFKMGLTYESKEARVLNSRLYETIYHAALTASCELAKDFGPHKGYEKTRIATTGKFHFEFETTGKSKEFKHLIDVDIPALNYDWESLRAKIKKYGLRNSLVTAQMPTAGSSVIMDVVESFEPIFSNVMLRQNTNGNTVVISEPVLAFYNGNVPTHIMAAISKNNGSIRSIAELSSIQELCKTAFEIDPKTFITYSCDRQRFIDQAQSFNLYLGNEHANSTVMYNVSDFRMILYFLSTFIFLIVTETSLV